MEPPGIRYTLNDNNLSYKAVNMEKFVNAFIIGLLAWTSTVHGQALDRSDVPENLQPWVDWVLHDVSNEDCPYLHNAGHRQCYWSSTLRLELNDAGGRFQQGYTVDRKSWVNLPGDREHWPRSVLVNARWS